MIIVLSSSFYALPFYTEVNLTYTLSVGPHYEEEQKGMEKNEEERRKLLPK